MERRARFFIWPVLSQAVAILSDHADGQLSGCAGEVLMKRVILIGFAIFLLLGSAACSASFGTTLYPADLQTLTSREMFFTWEQCKTAGPNDFDLSASNQEILAG